MKVSRRKTHTVQGDGFTPPTQVSDLELSSKKTQIAKVYCGGCLVPWLGAQTLHRDTCANGRYGYSWTVAVGAKK
jgi:hypothetical protein